MLFPQKRNTSGESFRSGGGRGAGHGHSDPEISGRAVLTKNFLGPSGLSLVQK